MVLNIVSVLVLVPTIWIVDAANGPGTNFTSLPAAVDAAQSGDTLIVRPGTYLGFSTYGKALTIYGSGSATVITPSGMAPDFEPTVIQAVPAGSAFTIAGVTFQAPAIQAFALPVTLRVLFGKVVLSDVSVTAAPGFTSGGHALQVEWPGGQVHAVRCTFSGGLGAGTSMMGGHGGNGALVDRGTLVADSCLFVGGEATDSASGFGHGVGGDGVAAYWESSHVSLHRTSCTGGPSSANGHGGSGVRSYGAPILVSGSSADVLQGGGYSSYGVWTGDTGPDVTVYGSVTILPGITGAPTFGNVVLVQPGLPAISIAGTASPSGELDAAATVTVTLAGSPLAPFVLGVSLLPAYTPVTEVPAPAPLLIGLAPTALVGFVEGSFGTSGEMTFSLIPLTDTPWLLNLPVHSQFGLLDGSGELRLSNEDVHVYRNYMTMTE